MHLVSRFYRASVGIDLISNFFFIIYSSVNSRELQMSITVTPGIWTKFTNNNNVSRGTSNFWNTTSMVDHNLLAYWTDCPVEPSLNTTDPLRTLFNFLYSLFAELSGLMSNNSSSMNWNKPTKFIQTSYLSIINYKTALDSPLECKVKVPMFVSNFTPKQARGGTFYNWWYGLQPSGLILD